MARKSSSGKKFVVVVLLAFAAYGAWTFWNKKETQKHVDQIERVSKAVKASW